MFLQRFALIGFGIAAFSINAAVLTEDFSSDPTLRGWKIFGNTNLARWNATNHNLEFTWDSSQTNTYFYHPLGTILGKSDDFIFSFDLTLLDLTPGVNPAKLYSFPLCAGLQNFANSTGTNFFRGNGHLAPNLVEFAFYPDTGFGPTIWPSFWSSNSVLSYNSSSDYTILDLPMHVRMHITMAYTATNKTAKTTITTNGVSIGGIGNLKLSSTYTDFRVGTVSIPNYSDGGQSPGDAGSVLAHGIIHSISVTTPDAPVQSVALSFSNSHWQAQFAGLTNWNYLLEASSNLGSWQQVASNTLAINGAVTLVDTNNIVGAEYYRVRALRP
ncbi:MAG: hypothetical protein ACXWBP_06850 [Limisphaerales bacterium]